MIGSIPYAAARPFIDLIVERVNQARTASGRTEPPVYQSPWAPARKFYGEAWRRGLDIKLGLGAFVMHAFCMAPLSALSVVVMYFLLRHMLADEQRAFWFAVLYAFGTPLFFRTGYLNQNMLVGHCALGAFAALTKG